MTLLAEKTFTVEGIGVPDTSLARQITQFVQDTEPALLFHHSSRVYYWGALAGKRHGLKFDRELLYAGAMFHDMGLTPAHSSADERFEVDGANAARDFLRSRGIGQDDIDTVWTAIVSAHNAWHSAAHASRRRSGDSRRRDGRAGARLRRI
jgi:HD superfamily phosphodiesterase